MSPISFPALLLVGLTVFAPAFGFDFGDGFEKIRAENDVEEKITQLTQQMKSNLENNDKQAVLDMYDEEVRMMPDGYPTIIGKENVDPLMGWVYNVAKVEFTSKEVAPLDSSAQYVFQRLKFKTMDTDGKVTFDGKHLVIWKKSDNTYKKYIIMYNSNSNNNSSP